MKKIITLFLLFSNILSAQTVDHKVDSILHLITQTKNDTTKIILYNIINSKVHDANPKLGNQYLEKAIEINHKLNWNLGYAALYNDFGTNYGNMGKSVVGLDYYIKSLDYSEDPSHEKYQNNKIKLKGIRQVSLNNITSIYLEQENIALAKKYNQMALALPDDNINQNTPFANVFLEFKAISLKNSAIINRLEGNTLEAKKHLDESLKIVRALKKPMREATFLFELGDATTDYLEKLDYYTQAKSIWDQHHFVDINYVENLNALTETMIKMVDNSDSLSLASAKKSREALIEDIKFYLDKSLKMADSLDADQAFIDIYKNRAHYEKLKGNYKNAFENLEKYQQLHDSIFSQEVKNDLAALQSANAIKLKDQKIKLNQEVINTKQIQNLVLFLGLILVSLLGLMLYYQNRLRKKKNKELNEANRIKTRFFNILNHDLRSPVGDLVRFLHLKKDHPEIIDQQTEDRLDKQTMTAAENLLVTMEDLLLWSKGQMENFKPHPKTISIKKVFNDIELLFSSNENVTISFENRKKIFLYTDENYLKTILRNLTSNAIKALHNTPNATIEWKAIKTNNNIILSIHDNGPGGTSKQFRALYDETEVIGVKNGLGLHLVRDMAKAIHCEIQVDSVLGKGTTIQLTF